MINPNYPASKYTNLQLLALEILDQQSDAETSERYATDPEALRYETAESRLTYAKECRASVQKMLGRNDAKPILDLMALSARIAHKVANVKVSVTRTEAYELEQLQQATLLKYDAVNRRFEMYAD